MHRLPPLHFLPAFEAAGRLKSFKAAAAELHLTASAVSQQLRAIEDALGIPLFRRKLRSVELTAAGSEYLREIQHALLEISSASRRVREHVQRRELRLSVPDFVAYEFVLPRIKHFRARFPHVDLRLDATSRVLDFNTCDVDAAIRVADGPWSGLLAEPLGDAVVAPVCAPELMASIHCVADLRSHTLIDIRGQEHRGWSEFLRRQGEPERANVMAFDGYLETLRAAEQGVGVAFGIFPMANAWIAGGRLSVPLPLRIPFLDKIHFVYRKADARGGLHRELGTWLRSEYRALPALEAGRIGRCSRA